MTAMVPFQVSVLSNHLFHTSIRSQSLKMYKYIIGTRRYKYKCTVDLQCPVPKTLLRKKGQLWKAALW
jgi:hypothetical protein